MPFRSLYQIVNVQFCFGKRMDGKGVDSVYFMNEIADADWYIESTLQN